MMHNSFILGDDSIQFIEVLLNRMSTCIFVNVYMGARIASLHIIFYPLSASRFLLLIEVYESANVENFLAAVEDCKSDVESNGDLHTNCGEDSCDNRVDDENDPDETSNVV